MQWELNIYRYIEQIKKKQVQLRRLILLYFAQADWSQTQKNAVIQVNKIIKITADQMHNVQIITV